MTSLLMMQPTHLVNDFFSISGPILYFSCETKPSSLVDSNILLSTVPRDMSFGSQLRGAAAAKVTSIVSVPLVTIRPKSTQYREVGRLSLASSNLSTHSCLLRTAQDIVVGYHEVRCERCCSGLSMA
jgi:hypothetical protein